MECKKYTIIESYPSILVHNVFIIALLITIVYFFLFWIELLRTLIKSFGISCSKGFYYLKHFFILKKEEHIEGFSSFKDFTIYSTNINNSKESNFNKIKHKIKETKIKFYSGVEALNLVNSLNENYNLNMNLNNLTKTNFILKEEVFLTDSIIEFNEKDFILTKGYNKAAINTYNLFIKILKK